MRLRIVIYLYHKSLRTALHRGMAAENENDVRRERRKVKLILTIENNNTCMGERMFIPTHHCPYTTATNIYISNLESEIPLFTISHLSPLARNYSRTSHRIPFKISQRTHTIGGPNIIPSEMDSSRRSRALYYTTKRGL